jgi:hypothetical protein
MMLGRFAMNDLFAIFFVVIADKFSEPGNWVLDYKSSFGVFSKRIRHRSVAGLLVVDSYMGLACD